MFDEVMEHLDLYLEEPLTKDSFIQVIEKSVDEVVVNHNVGSSICLFPFSQTLPQF